MKVIELKAIIENLPDDLEIVMSKDAEGNGFSPLAAHSHPDDVKYCPESTWSGEIINVEDIENDIAEGWEHNMDDYIDALILWPTN